MSKRITGKEILTKLEKHEAECAIKLDEINRRLDEGSKRFVRLEQYILGVYGAIFLSFIADKLI